MSFQETSPKPDIRFASRGSSYYDVLLAMFCVILVVSNIAATKGIEVGSGSMSLGPVQLWPIVADGGAILFPIAYIIGDLISEVYGFKAARRAVFVGFAMAVLTAVTFAIVQRLPAASFYENQAAFEVVAGPVGQIVVASLAGYTVGQLLNAYVLVKMKARTAERGLVGRLLASTFVGELADTFIFCAIAATAIGIDSFGVFLNYFVIGVLFKVSVEILVLPVTVQLIGWLKRREPTYAADPGGTANS